MVLRSNQLFCRLELCPKVLCIAIFCSFHLIYSFLKAKEIYDTDVISKNAFKQGSIGYRIDLNDSDFRWERSLRLEVTDIT